ncbi:MAG: hexitol phosphatase HxpB [Actinomycetota bacterium]
MTFHRLKAAIFDMDGLLVDTERLWHQAEMEILGELGVEFNRAVTRSSKGMRVDEVVAMHHGDSPWPEPSLEVVIEQILQRVADLAESVGNLLPGVLSTFEILDQAGLPKVLASSTPYRLIERILKHFDLVDRFETISSAQDEPYGKPHPGVFLSAARSISIEPTACVVFEDAPAGVLAAKAARMLCIAVPEPDEREHPMIRIADVVLPTLEDFSLELLQTLDAGLQRSRG